MRKMRALVALAVAASMTVAAPSYASKPKVIRWTNPELIQTMPDAKKYMHGTPLALKKVIVREAKKVIAADPSCEYPSGARIHVYTTSGYAEGSVGGCGGAEMFLTDFGRGKRHSGKWRAVLFTQEALTCAFDKKYKMPSSIVGTTCYNQARTRGTPYHQR